MTTCSLRAALLFITCALALGAETGTELRFCIRADPKTFDPALVEDDSSEVVRYLTAGVLLRVNRVTQQLMPELAESWKIDDQGRRITFHLRQDVTFSDGTPFGAEDVAYTIKRLMDPQTHSATADPFRSSTATPAVAISSGHTIAITFGAPVSGVERLFDQVGIQSVRSQSRTTAFLGPFVVAGYKPGIEVLLRRNPRYWKVDADGRRLPYVDRIRLAIQQSRDLELLRFRRGELDLITSVDPETFAELESRSGFRAIDAGVSLESEMMWFNQVPSARLPSHKKAWFASPEFRNAISEAINRDDLCRIVYKGHARPANGPISPGNRFWVNGALKARSYNPNAALKRLEKAGFSRSNGFLSDREGHRVEFAVITNAGNKSREKMAAMIQQDLQAIGVRMNIVTLDFPSLIERISQTFQYEACLLGLTNVDLDPNGQMNVWLSSAGNHQWNPNQKNPATPWEAEIDRLMRMQAKELKLSTRKRLFDRIQEIVWEEEPFIYLINKHSLMAFSAQVRNVAPTCLQPWAYWNIEFLNKGVQILRR